jgi:hypothetical protein
MSEKPLELKPGHPAERSIYATRDGRLVEEDDPEASELVVGAGGVVTEKMAKRYRGGGAAPAEGVPVPSDAATQAAPEGEEPPGDEESEEPAKSGHAKSKK